jgi:membrane-bound inhibitor of C-type lysozyme
MPTIPLSARSALPALAAVMLLGASAHAQPAIAVQSTVVLTLGTDGDAEKRVIRYECEGLEPFAVEYINARPNFLALVPVEGETMIFAAVLSASGARYAAGSWEWWTSGSEASLRDLTQGPDAEPVATCLEFTETP